MKTCESRKIPVPAEYNWETLQAIIRSYFKDTPSGARVMNDEYEIFYTSNRRRRLSSNNFTGFIPGTSITMSIVLARTRYGTQCPRPRCGSNILTASPAGGSIWLVDPSSLVPVH